MARGGLPPPPGVPDTAPGRPGWNDDARPCAAGAVRQALRHAGIGVAPGSVHVQREPFEARGAKVDQFDLPSRFAERGCYHVELGFNQPVEGPLVLGDGRYLGLGVMAPAQVADSPGQGTADKGGSRKPAKESG